MTQNTMTRRDMLKVSGITALGLGGALTVGLGARANTAGTFAAGEGSPYEAWRALPRDGSPQALIAAAILGANPHNTQPWQFAVDGDSISVSADRSRALPATDPTDAELVTGLGCAIENLAVAAAAAGRAATVEAGGPGATVARVALRSQWGGGGCGPVPRDHAEAHQPWALSGRSQPAGRIADGRNRPAGLPAARGVVLAAGRGPRPVRRPRRAGHRGGHRRPRAVRRDQPVVAGHPCRDRPPPRRHDPRRAEPATGDHLPGQDPAADLADAERRLMAGQHQAGPRRDRRRIRTAQRRGPQTPPTPASRSAAPSSDCTCGRPPRDWRCTR